MAQRARGQTTSQPTKKMVIKPFKAKPKLPEQFEETTWAKLHSAVQAIHQHQTVSQSMQELYQAVQDLCLHNLAASCFSRLQTLCEDHITLMITKLVGQTPDPVEFLNLMEECWDDHVNQMTTIRHVFMYLDRSYVLQNAPVRSLWDMGLQLFRKHLGAFEDVERKLVTGILTLIERERAGDTVNRSQLRNLLRMLSAIGTYGDQFEGAFLSATSSFYAEESRRTRDTCDIPDFLRYVDRRLAEENERVNNYLDPNTRRALIAAAERELLEEHVDAIIDKGFDSLMDDNRHADLARMYSHLQRVNALGQLRVSFTAYVKRSGGEIVTNEETDKDMVENLLVFKAKLDFVLTEAFENNDDLGHALKDAFESFINIRQNKPAELIAKFIDAKLKSGNKASSAEEVEVILDRVMVIFRHIQGKDVFEAFFKKDLAKRLLMGKSASIDAEKSMISKLKQQCGSTFTNKLEGMFKDIDLSRDVMLSFKENAAMKARLSDFDISVHVLTTGFWPPYQPAPLNLPKQLADAQDVFQFFYLSKHSGRRLVWQHSLGHSTLRARFPLGQKELLVSAYQTVVLLLFNDTESLSFPDIKEATAMDDKELRVTLQSLACGKIRVLRKNPKGRDIHDGDTFTFNTEFHNKLLRIKINSIQMKETTEENQSTTERVFQDRQYQIDAAVVRVMKARKSLQHQLLISELYKQLKFPVAPPDLKKRIESLIDREYLERDLTNSTVYNYVA